MKPVDEMTHDELRREIAEALGYRVLPHYFPVSDRTGYALVDRDGAPVGLGYNYWFEEEPWGECPDWLNEEGAALALCWDVLDTLNENPANGLWVLEFGTAHVSFEKHGLLRKHLKSSNPFSRDAQGMSRLAHAVLREMKKGE